MAAIKCRPLTFNWTGSYSGIREFHCDSKLRNAIASAGAIYINNGDTNYSGICRRVVGDVAALENAPDGAFVFASEPQYSGGEFIEGFIVYIYDFRTSAKTAKIQLTEL